jgi:hypothetical protein
MAIKFETASGPQGKQAEKKAETARPRIDEDKEKAEASPEGNEDDKASAKIKKPRGSFKRK